MRLLANRRSAAPRPLSEGIGRRGSSNDRDGDPPGRSGPGLTGVCALIGVVLLAAALVVPSSKDAAVVPVDALQPVHTSTPGGGDAADVVAGRDRAVGDAAATATRTRSSTADGAAGSSSAGVTGADLVRATREEAARRTRARKVEAKRVEARRRAVKAARHARRARAARVAPPTAASGPVPAPAAAPAAPAPVPAPAVAPPRHVARPSSSGGPSAEFGGLD